MKTSWAHQQACGFLRGELIYIQLKKKHKSMADEQFEINPSFTKPAINETDCKENISLFRSMFAFGQI